MMQKQWLSGPGLMSLTFLSKFPEADQILAAAWSVGLVSSCSWSVEKADNYSYLAST
jgi:hypothetical protein